MGRVSCLVALLAALAGCTSLAAQQALGENGQTINANAAQRLEPGRLYRVKPNGTFREVCTDDRQNRKVQAITTNLVTDSNDTLTDAFIGEDVTVSFPGVPEIQVPYVKTKVTGYTVRQAAAPGDADLGPYYRAAVGGNCRKIIKAGGVMLVESEARAKKSAKIYKSPVQEIPIGLGKIVTGPQTVPGPANVTFGVIAASD
jgi:hypothetical protein